MKLADVIRTARMVKVEHARKFAQHVVPEVVRPARVIWNQAVGGIFLLFAVFFFITAAGYYRQANNLALALAAFMGLVMAIFGTASFRKARRIARRF
jgi:hypothetical protein